MKTFALIVCVALGNAASASTPKEGAAVRTSKAAIDFVNRFNSQLGLSAKAARKKDAHMASNPSHFMTAMPALFYQDVRGPFAAESKLRETASPSGLLVGDAHLGNLMTRSGPEGKTVWGWGDCDKSGSGLLEWDLDRLAAHTVISARLADQKFSRDDEKDFVGAVAAAYTKQLREFAATGDRPAGFLKPEELSGALSDFAKQAASRSQKHFINHHAPDGNFAKAVQAGAEDAAAIKAAVADYASRLPKDAPIAKPIQVLSLGVEPPSTGGSNSGLVKYLVLVAPANPKDLPIALKFKQVLPSAADNGTGELSQADASRVVENAAMLQGFRDPLLGYAKVRGQSCLVEPMTANSDILEPAGLSKKDFLGLAASAGEALARSQLQSPALTQQQIKAWLGAPSTDAAASKQLHQFAVDYADQTQADAKALKNG